MNWYEHETFRCPTCEQQLKVERGRVRRNEIVTCNDCNTDLLLAERGTVDDELRAEAAREDAELVELKL